MMSTKLTFRYLSWNLIPKQQFTRLRVVILNIKKTFTILSLALILGCTAANAYTLEEIKTTIVNQAVELGIDPALALSIAKVESNFRMEARSSCGAVGVFQLMPSTAKKIGINPYSLSDNIRGGLKYYLMMYRMFGSVELALAAYNAGPGNVKRYNNTVPPFGETKRFVEKIMALQNVHKNDPAVLQAKAPKPVVVKTAPVVQEEVKPEPQTEQKEEVIDIEAQKASSVIIETIVQEITAI